MREASAFARYILGRPADARTAELYDRGVRELDEADAVVRFAVERPWAIGALDGALALCDPQAPLRRRLLLMVAILEARPQYCDDFLPRQRSWLDAAVIALRVMRAGLLAIGGFVLLRMLRGRTPAQ